MPDAQSPAKRVLSGVQPTGNLHLGNYFGAIRHWVGMQDSHECFFMLADLHAITVPQNPAQLRQNTRETAAAYIACGIDPEKSVIFPQSAVSGHSELAWILSCHTPLGWLNRMTQFKQKAAIKFKSGVTEAESAKTLESIRKVVVNATFLPEDANLGLFGYPVLMAADILLYKATHVPVGEDQKQHLELSRDVAGAFNRHYGVEFFPLPEPLIRGEATRVMSLRDGTKKMSKSDPSEYSRIHLTDDAETIALKIRKAKSDMAEGMQYDPENRPEAANLLTLYAAVKNIKVEQAAAECTGDNFSAFKHKLADAMVAHLAPISARMRELLADPAELDRLLARGTEKARTIAEAHMREVKEKVGLWR